MPVYIACPACKSTLRLKENFARKQARCPYCRQVIDVPNSATDTANAQLGSVDEQLKARARALGIEVGAECDLAELSRLIDAAESGRAPRAAELDDRP